MHIGTGQDDRKAPSGADAAARAASLIASAIVWDNHACMPLREDADQYLPQLERHRRAGASLVSLNVHFGGLPWEEALLNLARYRRWLADRTDAYLLVESVADIHAAKAGGKLGIVFDIEGGIPVEPHPGLVEIYYRLGVRWMLLAYNRNNRLGGGCQDEDEGLTAYGRTIIDEMARTGMILCCSHTGYRTAREAMDYSDRPVLFTHSNPRALCDHPRNIPDSLIRMCAATGGVVGINGFGIFLGGATSAERVADHIFHVADLVGPAHVGLGLDYVFDQEEMDDWVRTRPDLFPADKGYSLGMPMVDPETIPAIVETLLRRGMADADVEAIVGGNFLRVAGQVWT